MVRLILENKSNVNWFKQFKCLRQDLKLNLRESIKLFYSLKRGKIVIVQAVKNEHLLNDYLDKVYHSLKSKFNIELSNVYYGVASMVDASHYTCNIIDYRRGYRIYISRM